MVPRYEDLNMTGLDFSKAKYDAILKVTKTKAVAEAEDQGKYFAQFGTHLPKEVELERQLFAARLERSPEVWEIKD